MLLRHRKALTAWQRDWHTEQRRERITESSPSVVWTRVILAGIAAVYLVWWLWAMTGDAAQAFFYRLAGG